MTRRILVVSDVDGTLLDENGRLPCSAAALHERLDAVASAHAATCSVVLASSRTLAELVVLQRGLGLRGACIAEDGAVLAVDVDVVPPVVLRRGGSSVRRAGRRTVAMWSLGDSATELRAELSRAIAPYELDPADARAMASLGFRSHGSVRRALVARQSSVLLDLRGADAGTLTGVREAVASSQAHLHRGGRWHTVTRGAGKGAATNMLRRLLATDVREPMCVIGIGNEENDATLLASADVGFAIRNRGSGVHPALAAVRGVIPLTSEGTGGFLEMLERLVDMPLFAPCSAE